MAEEVKVIQKRLIELTGAQFKVVKLRRDSPVWRDKLVWLIQCSDLQRLGETGYANTVWKDPDSNVCIDTVSIGDTLEWIETEYGEQACGEAINMKFGQLTSREDRQKFGERFPTADKRLRAYEAMVERVSATRSVDIMIRREKSEGITTFYVTAKVSVAELDLNQEVYLIERNVEALREVLGYIDRYVLCRRAGFKKRVLSASED